MTYLKSINVTNQQHLKKLPILDYLKVKTNERKFKVSFGDQGGGCREYSVEVFVLVFGKGFRG